LRGFFFGGAGNPSRDRKNVCLATGGCAFTGLLTTGFLDDLAIVRLCLNGLGLKWQYVQTDVIADHPANYGTTILVWESPGARRMSTCVPLAGGKRAFAGKIGSLTRT
jgi:hypothetical protein